MNLDSLSLDELNQLLNTTERGAVKTYAPNLSQNKDLKKDAPQRSKTRSFAEGALDSATLGFAPKIIGAVGAPILQAIRPDLFGDQSYEDVYKQFRDYSRDQMAQSQEANPISYGLGGVAGGAALPFPTNTVKGAAGLGALYGAASGLGGNDTGEAFTLGASDAASALKGGAIGGILGGGVQALSNKLFGKRIPNQEVNQRLDIGEKFNVPLTKGEALQSEAELLKEEAALRGRLGGRNLDEIKEFNTARTEQYKKSAEELVSKIGGGKNFTEKGANVGEAVNGLVDKALQERQDYSGLYKAAKDNVGALKSQEFAPFIENITRDLEESFLSPDNVPGAFNELKALNSKLSNSNNINIKELEAWRQGLNRSYKGALRSGDEQAAFALSSIKNKFDGFMDSVIDGAIDNNNTELVGQLKQARTLAAEWFGKYSTQNKQDYGKKFVQDIINNKRHAENPYTNEQIVNKLFGSSELGFKPESAAIVKELKKLLPEQDFNNIKLEAAQKFIQPLLKNTPNVTTYKNNLDKFIRSNPTLAKELFSKSELQDLGDLGKLGATLFTREKSMANPSGTAAVVLNYLKDNKYTGWLNNLFTKIETDQNAIRKGAEIKQGTQLNRGLSGGIITESQNKVQPMQGAGVGTQQPQDSKNVQQNEIDALSKDELENLLRMTEGAKAGVEENGNSALLERIAKVESGNNPNAKNPNSSASGLFQITDGTWRDLQKKYGLSGNKNDPENQRLAAEYLLKENKDIIENAVSREATDGELYMAHFLGPRGAVKLIKSMDSSEPAARLFPAAAKSNKNIFFANGKPLTAKQVYTKLNNLV